MQKLTRTNLCISMCVSGHPQGYVDMDDMTPMPRFTSRGQTYRAVLGDTLVLPCEIQNVGE